MALRVRTSLAVLEPGLVGEGTGTLAVDSTLGSAATGATGLLSATGALLDAQPAKSPAAARANTKVARVGCSFMRQAYAAAAALPTDLRQPCVHWLRGLP